MKIAFPTEDSRLISAHFGRAPYFLVAEVTPEGEPRFEQRSKSFHGPHDDHHHHEPDPAAHNSMHQGMFGAIADCQVLIAGGMGQPAYEHALAVGLEVILTSENDISAALQKWQAHELTSDPRRIHFHR